jgi:hypothetical protein
MIFIVSLTIKNIIKVTPNYLKRIIVVHKELKSEHIQKLLADVSAEMSYVFAFLISMCKTMHGNDGPEVRELFGNDDLVEHANNLMVNAKLFKTITTV